MTATDHWRRELRELGRDIGPDVRERVSMLFVREQEAAAQLQTPTAVDLAYGDHPRQRLDVYGGASDGRTSRPILVWVHGGGYVQGEKSSPHHPFNAHIGRWAARRGALGVVINHRLAPEHVWPAGAEDVGLVIEWLRTNAATFGGNPEGIVLVGTSSGAAHIATCLGSAASLVGVRGAVLLSGLYGFSAYQERDAIYYGSETAFLERASSRALIETKVPLLIACAEYDPPRFQEEMVSLLAARFRERRILPRSMVVAGHNHYSIAAHIGGSDHQLADSIIQFVNDATSLDER